MHAPHTKPNITHSPQRFRKGFTVAEMLVVVVIIGILAAIVTVTYNSARIRTGDTERESDIQTVKHAIDKWATEHGVYPPQGGSNGMNTNFPVTTVGIPREALINPDAPSGTTNSMSEHAYGTNPDYTEYGYRAFYDGTGAACWQVNGSCAGYKLAYTMRSSGETVVVAGGVCTTEVPFWKCNADF